MKITVDLLRRRAEHNGRVLRTLEELTLHQFDIRKIELIQEHCKMLKIVYLQNNKISVIENVSKLKRLEYLNLTLNCISRISGLRGCESLYKLDLTLNAITVQDLLPSLYELMHNELLRELHLSGNPCSKWSEYRSLVIGVLPQLSYLDGKQITDEERQDSIMHLSDNKELLHTYLSEHSDEINEENHEQTRWIQDRLKDMDDIKDEVEEKRREIREEEQRLLDQDLLRKSKLELNRWLCDWDDTSSDLPKQRNIPRITFEINEQDIQHIEVILRTPKHVSTSHLRTDIHPKWMQCSVKGDLFVLHFPVEITPDLSSIRRIRATGHLHLTLVRVNPLKKKGQHIIDKHNIDSSDESDTDWDTVPDLI